MAHTRTSGRDSRQGSMFNKVIMLPTLAPEITRPYHIPGTPEFISAQAELRRQLAQPNDAQGPDATTVDNAAPEDGAAHASGMYRKCGN